MNSAIFRQYDIRGKIDTDLTESVMADIGRAIGTYFRRQNTPTLTVGRDCRTHSKRLFDALTDGLMSTGIDLLDLGVVPTPILYYSVFDAKVDGGVMLTGSHTSAPYNGVKISLGRTSLFGETIQHLRKLIEARDFETGNGAMTERQTHDSYVQYLQQNIRLGYRDLRVVVDAGNGTAGNVILPLLERLGVEAIPLYCEPDGQFPNHPPDPAVPQHLEDLSHVVQDEMADIGIAFDCDADRIGVVDSEGDVIAPDRLLVLFARDILRSNPGATIVSEVKTSQTFYDDIRARGGRAIMWKTGHSEIKAKMKDVGALLGGEMSGHMFFAHRYFGYDDAIYAAVRLIELLTRTEGSLRELLDDIPQMFATPEIRLESIESEKFDIIARARELFEIDHVVHTIDGVRVDFEGGWGLLRASNTEPVIVLRCEATTPDRLDEIKALMESVLVEAGGRPFLHYYS